MITERLKLVAATVTYLDAELESPDALGRLLGARVPESWPPGEYDRSAIAFFRERLVEDSAAAGWYGWYAIHRRDVVVIGAVGYLGPPDTTGTVEVGYSIVPEYRGQGYGGEIVQALAARAWTFVDVKRVIAHVSAGNTASIKVLERAGFRRSAGEAESGDLKYEQLRSPEDGASNAKIYLGDS